MIYKKLNMVSVLRTNYLRTVPKLILFLTSYSPLFVCIIVRQLYYNRSFLHFAGFDKMGIMLAMVSFTAIMFIFSVTIMIISGGGV